MKIAILQINSVLGNFDYNVEKILKSYKQALKDSPDIVVTPMYSLSGVGGKNLLNHHSFLHAHIDAMQKIVAGTIGSNIPLIFSAIMVVGGSSKNRILSACNGELELLDTTEFKFKAGVVSIISRTDYNYHVGGNITIKLDASPYEFDSYQERIKIAKKHVEVSKQPFIYVNCVGGQDSLVYDGGSFVMSEKGEIINQLPFHMESITCLDTTLELAPKDYNINENIYNTMVLGLRDYVNRNKFKGIVLGLSGGIDSALSVAVSVDALGADRVLGVRLPSLYTSKESMDIAEISAKTLGIRLETLPIIDAVSVFNSSLSGVFKGLAEDKTEENIQSRTRGVLLMALSNKFNYLLLATGNKSECSVGYATLYGDMCGGFNVLQDLYKVQVYELSKWRNSNIPSISLINTLNVIPEASITRAPSAELKPNQKDQDSLPPYEVLDSILPLFIDKKLSPSEVIKQGFDKETVKSIWKMLMGGEYKRKQGSIGIAFSPYAFSKNWHYPNTNEYTEYELKSKE